MPIAEFELPDGRLAEFEVPEGLSPQQLEFEVNRMFSEGELPTEEPQDIYNEEFLAPDSNFIDPFKRGIARGSYGLDLFMNSIGVKSDEEFAADTSKLASTLSGLPYSKEYEEQAEALYKSTGAGDFLKKAIFDSPAFWATTISESLGTVAKPLAAGVAAGTVAGKVAKVPMWGSRLIAGLSAGGFGSGMAEAGGEIFEGIAERGYDVENPEEVQMALQDESLMIKLRKRARNRGLSVGAFDALSIALSGLPLGMIAPKGASIGRKALGLTADMAAQAGYGMSGEALAQMTTDGGITDPISVAVEGIAEFITGGPQGMASLTYDRFVNPQAAKLKSALAGLSGKVLEADRIRLLGEVGEEVRGRRTADLPFVEGMKGFGEKPTGIFGDDPATKIDEEIAQLEEFIDQNKDKDLTEEQEARLSGKKDRLKELKQVQKSLKETGYIGDRADIEQLEKVFGPLEDQYTPSLFEPKETLKNAQEQLADFKWRKSFLEDFVKSGEEVPKEWGNPSEQLKKLDEKIKEYTKFIKESGGEELTEAQINLQKAREGREELKAQVERLKELQKIKKSERTPEQRQEVLKLRGKKKGRPGSIRRLEDELSKIEKENALVYDEEKGTYKPFVSLPEKLSKAAEITEQEIQKTQEELQQLQEQEASLEAQLKTLEKTVKGAEGRKPLEGKPKDLARVKEGIENQKRGIAEIKEKLKQLKARRKTIEKQRTKAARVEKPATKEELVKQTGPLRYGFTDKVLDLLQQYPEISLDEMLKEKAKDGSYKYATGKRRGQEITIKDVQRYIKDKKIEKGKVKDPTEGMPEFNLEDPLVVDTIQQFYQQQQEEIKKQQETPVQEEPIRKLKAAEDLIQAPIEDFLKSFGPKLVASELSPDAIRAFEGTIKKIKDILRQVAGPDINVEIVSEALELNKATNEIEAIRGALWTNMIIVALETKSGTNPVETAFHEAWHALSRTGFFKNPKIQAIIKRGLPRYKTFLSEKTGMLEADFDRYMTDPELREELAALTFGLVAYEWYSTGKINTKTGLPKDSKSLFKRAYKAITRIWDAIRGVDGVNNLQDLFVNSYEGAYAVQDIVDYDTLARHQRASAGQQVAEQAASVDQERIINLMRETVKKMDVPGGPKMLSLPAHLGYTKMGLGQNGGLWKYLMRVTKFYKELAHKRTESYVDAADKYLSIKDTHKKYAIADVMLYNNLNGRKAVYDEATDTLTYERDGIVRRITDPEAVRGYRALQEALAMVLEEEINLYRTKTLLAFPELEHDFTKQDVDRLISQTENKKKQKKLENVKEMLQNFEDSKKADYVPKMRFGTLGVAVYRAIRDPDTGERKKGELVYFNKIESTKPLARSKERKFYHSKQYELLQQDMRERGFDDDAYIIAGGDIDKLDQEGFQEEKIDTLTLFSSTRELEKNFVDAGLYSLEMVSGMLHSQDMTPEMLAEARKALEFASSEQGFQQKFTKARNIEGFSTDWDKVFRTYFHGAGQNIEFLHQSPIFTELTNLINSSKDPHVKRFAPEYLNYTTRAAEDLQTVRQMNFVWTMGFNPSTAVLQYFTLPTVTLGMMMQHSPNIIGNMQKIMKWGKYGMLLFKYNGVRWKNGSLILDITNEKFWNTIWNKNKHLPGWTEEAFERMKAHAIEQYKRGNLGAVLVEEAAGQTFGEGLTIGEQASNKANKLVQNAGFMIAFAEQNTRFASLMAVLEQQLTDPRAHSKARRVYANEEAFQAMPELEPGTGMAEHISTYVMERSHAIFGKTNRPEAFKGIGGAFIFAFMTWPHAQWGNLYDMMTRRGMEGKLGAATVLLMTSILGGALAIPGAELAKELFELMWKEMTGIERDLMGEIMASNFDPKALEAFSYGIMRQPLGLQASERIQLPIPGEKIILSLMGASDDPSAVLGVSGSMIEGVIKGWQQYRQDGSALAIASEMLPVQMANVTKSMQYTMEGVKTGKGTQLLTEDEVSPLTVVSRAIGVTTAQHARERERHWYAQVLDRQHRPGYDRYVKKLTVKASKMQEAIAKGNSKRAAQLQEEYQVIINNLDSWAEKNDIQIPWPDMFGSINDKLIQRRYGGLSYDQYSKQYRLKIKNVSDAIDQLQGGPQ